ncbi:hypothetical protein ACHAXM_002021 [Skeletonema potamos]|jgi:coproporphyrinogen III oxidase
MFSPLPTLSSVAVCCFFFSTIATKVEAFSASQSLAASRVGGISNDASSTPQDIFEEFTKFLIEHQTDMICKIEQADGSENSFSRDGWGAFANDNDSSEQQTKSGGITRVIQGGNVVEKGACSLTVIRNGVLTADRAATIQGRQQQQEGDLVVQEGDIYSAAALSVVLHTRNPFVPTFRSDVRIFLVKSSTDDSSVAWFGGGSDLTPYYLIDEDISKFHNDLKQMCDLHFPENNEFNLSHAQMKQLCDEYFYLPARSEHRGTGGIFFDDLPATPATLAFVKDVAAGWMPSWLPIVEKNGNKEYTEEQKHWQCLRRGRYLEFNLLYDRGVKFGLANANPRVEGVMVSAPPKIAFDYNHVPAKGSEEERLLKVLKEPKDWTVVLN